MTVRLFRLYLTSRQVPGSAAVLASLAVAVRIAQQARWIHGRGADAHQTLLLIECAAACAVAMIARNPFGESEETTGRLLPHLRLSAALTLSAGAVCSLALGAAGTQLPGGWFALPRDVAGLIGVGLLSAQIAGGALAWLGTVAYTVVAEFALMEGWRTVWMWSGCSAHDLRAAWAAWLMFAAGTALFALRGSQD